MKTLKNLQREMARVLLPRSGQANEKDRRVLAQSVKSTKQFPATSRINLYREMCIARHREVLQQRYPELAQQLHDKDFTALVCLYLSRFPPREAQLQNFGAKLPQLLRELKKQERKLIRSP